MPATANYTANALNQYTATPSATSLAYDADGNMTSGPLPAHTGANSTLVWDAENRLVQVTVNGTITSYGYDHQSRLISKTTGAVVTRFVYDGWNMITEYTGSTLKKSYTWGMDLSGTMQGAGGVGGLLAVTDSTGSYFPSFDGNGNVSEYLDSTGAVVAHYEYDPFGKTTVATGAKSNDFTHRFSTKPLDSETGIYYYGYRYYDPQTGRWPSRDPIGEQGGVNLYAFVGNDGVNKRDWLGLAVSRYKGNPSNFQLSPLTDEKMNPKEDHRRAGFIRLDKWSMRVRQVQKEIGGKTCYGVLLSGELKLSGFFNSSIGSDPGSGAHNPGGYFSYDLSTLKHEQKHVEIYSRWWNQAADLVNVYEHYYCKKKCQEAAADIAEATRGLYKGYAEQENGKFDRTEYGGGATSIRDGSAYIDLYEPQLERALKVFQDNVCMGDICTE